MMRNISNKTLVTTDLVDNIKVVKCRERYAKYRETHRRDMRENAKQYYEENRSDVLYKKL